LFNTELVFVYYLVVNTSIIDTLKRLVSKMTYYVLSGMLNSANSLTYLVNKSHTLGFRPNTSKEDRDLQVMNSRLTV